MVSHQHKYWTVAKTDYIVDIDIQIHILYSEWKAVFFPGDMLPLLRMTPKTIIHCMAINIEMKLINDIYILNSTNNIRNY